MKKLLTTVMAMAVVTGVALAAEKVSPPPQTLFTNVKVFNGGDNKLLAVAVPIEGNLIKAIGVKLKTSKDAKCK
jgi:hypothetical protein